MPEGDADLTARVKQLAREGGFDHVGVAPAGRLADADRLLAWLAAGRHGSMAYMARHAEKRVQPGRLVPGARSVLCLAVGYAPPPGREAAGEEVARFARGRDYHKVLKRRCIRLMDRIRGEVGDFVGRALVDSAPLLERSAARAAGLGWIGRNCCLIVPGLGSYVALCEMVSDLPLRPDEPLEGGCGDCGACLAACPTGALGEWGLDARLCVSYLTMEHAGAIDSGLWGKMGRRLAGCDRCQEVCPHNAAAPAGDAELTGSGEVLGGASLAEVLRWSRADWDRATRGSTMRRAGYEGLLRNAVIAAGNSVDRADRAELAAAVGTLRGSGLVAEELVEWALGRLG